MTTLTPTATQGSRMTDQTGVRFGLANGVLVAGVIVVALLPLHLGEAALLVLLVATAVSMPLPQRLAAVLGLEAWAFFTGFLENRYGVLTLTQGDLLHLAGFVTGVVVLAPLLRTPAAIASRRTHS